ncbi:hypothetical protein M5C99_10175 [Acidovorax sp. NCPPB 2350]|nr:hypothetical protein M5C99_10175 [Acidovorax sp. NCPPB 2350]
MSSSDTTPSRPAPSAPTAAASAPHRAGRLWGWPIALGVLTTSGLLSALVSEGLGDAWSWFALGVPVATMAWFGWVRRPHRA